MIPLEQAGGFCLPLFRFIVHIDFPALRRAMPRSSDRIHAASLNEETPVWYESIRIPGGIASRPGFRTLGRRPALVLQHDRFNTNHLNTVVVVAINSNLGYALYLQSGVSEGKGSLPKTCVANVTQIQTIGRAYLIRKSRNCPSPVVAAGLGRSAASIRSR